ncbi:nucleoside-diphosphate sugar epimerase/dehydratase [Desulfatiferula olefinivorans]
MKHIRIYRNLVIILFLDALVLGFSYYLAHLARFDFKVSSGQAALMLKTLPLVVLIKIGIFYVCNLYRGMWRFTSIQDVMNIVKAAVISSCVIVGGLLIYNRFQGFSRSVFVNDLCFTILAVAGIRLSVRIFFEHYSGFFVKLAGPELPADAPRPRRLLIIGAGAMGEKIFRLIRDAVEPRRYAVVGFLDDHPVKIGKLIHGVKVLGAVRDIKAAVEKTSAEEALIAIPSATSEQMREIVRQCKAAGIVFKTLPTMDEMINGQISVNSIREVAYTDLLGRKDIKLDEGTIGDSIKGRVVMVTGAGGSIGSELCRQICRFKPKRILLYERAESPLYEIDLELRNRFTGVGVVPILADIQNMNQLERTFSMYKPEIVYHAAAYKHVPMLEAHAWKAVRNNVIGTFNLSECATKFEIDRFVFVSTDKAVRPTNVMGATKRIAEILIQNQEAFKKCRTKFMIVRFGNVVGSAGSVLPLFKRQIERGGPVTVTHPEVTRYFMTIPEAAQLILQAGAMGEGGEIFILDMGEPIKIDHIARDLIRLSGLEPGKDIRIDYVGLRPGEKLYEELITEGEGIVPTEHKKIMVLRGEVQNLQILNGNIGKLAALAEEQDTDRIIEKLKAIVPEYSPVRH